MSRLVPVYWAFVVVMVGLGVMQLAEWSPALAVAAALLAGLGAQLEHMRRHAQDAARERQARSAGYVQSLDQVRQ